MKLSRPATMVVTALLVAGCSSQPAPSEPGVTDPSPASHGSLAECLRSKGVTDPSSAVLGPPAGVDPEIWNQAMAACSTLAPGPAGP